MKLLNHYLLLLQQSFLCGSILFLIASCGSDIEPQIPKDTKPSELSLQKLIIALKANKNPEKMLAEKRDLENYLSKKLSRAVEVIIPTDSATVVESFRNGTLDLGYLSSTDASEILIRKRPPFFGAPQNGKPHYNSIWLTQKETLSFNH